MAWDDFFSINHLKQACQKSRTQDREPYENSGPLEDLGPWKVPGHYEIQEPFEDPTTIWSPRIQDPMRIQYPRQKYNLIN